MAECHVAEVAGQELAGQRLPKASQYLDGFHGSKASHSSRDGSKNWKLPTPCRGILGVQARQARCLSGQDRGDLKLAIVHCTVDQGLALFDALTIHGKPFGEQRRAVDDKIHIADELFGIVFGEVFGNRHDFESRVEFFESSAGRFDPWSAQALVSHQ